MCACAWVHILLQGLQSWVCCPAVYGPHTHLCVLGRKACGVGPGLVFAAHLLRSGGAQRVGLVPCAVGGTAMDRWMPGADLYEQMARPLVLGSDENVSARGNGLHLTITMPAALRLHLCTPCEACTSTCRAALYRFDIKGQHNSSGCHTRVFAGASSGARPPHTLKCMLRLLASCTLVGRGATSMVGPDRQVSRAQSAVAAAPGPASLRVLLWYQVRSAASVQACAGPVTTCLSCMSLLLQSFEVRSAGARVSHFRPVRTAPDP
jgi:hypothetical protein